MTRRWLQSADVEIDDASGALLVKIGDAKLKVDMAEVDVSAIVAGIAGAGDEAKTLTQVVAALANLANIPASPATEGGNLATVAARLLHGSDSAAALLATVAAAGASVVRASSGTAPLSTSSDAAVEALAANATDTYYHVRIFNTGGVTGFWSPDGGTTWWPLLPNRVDEPPGLKIVNKTIQFKRIAGGADVTGVYCTAW